jgi:hypothetical protein
MREAPAASQTPAPAAAPEPAATTEAKSETPGKPESASPAPAAAAVPPDELIKCYNDIVFIRSGKAPNVTPELVADYEKKWATLLAKSPAPAPMCEEADLVASSFKKPEKEGDPTFLYVLFQVNKSFEKDLGLNIRGYVDVSHKQRLPERDRGNGFADLGYMPDLPTSQWEKKSVSIGEKSYVLIRRGGEMAEIPYNFKIAFFTIEGKGKESKIVSHGEAADLGWLVAD